MPETPGYRFSPLQRPEPGEGRRSPGGASTPQEAIRVLSLRVPQVVGARSLAPGPLLNAPGASGITSPLGTPQAPNLGGVEEILRRLFALMQGPAGPSLASPAGVPVAPPALASFGAPQLSQPPAAAAAPAPRIIAGIQAGGPSPGSFQPGPIDLGGLHDQPNPARMPVAPAPTSPLERRRGPRGFL